MASDNYDEKYTKPDLRRKIKDELQQSDKGGKPGQWSARKSQLLVQEYERRGGGYKNDAKDDAARSLEEWTDQNWQTQDGEADARQGDVTSRYLPEEVWNRLSDAQKQELERIKRAASRNGEQYAPYPESVKQVYRDVVHGTDDEPTKEVLYERAQALEIDGRSQMNKDDLAEAVAAAEARQLENLTRDELYERAQTLEIAGRSQMNKDELIAAIRQAEDDRSHE